MPQVITANGYKNEPMRAIAPSSMLLSSSDERPRTYAYTPHREFGRLSFLGFFYVSIRDGEWTA